MYYTHKNLLNNHSIDEYTIAYAAQNPTECILVHDVEYWSKYVMMELKDKSKFKNLGAYFDDFLFDKAIPKYNEMSDSSFICIHYNWWGLVFFSKDYLFKYLKYTYSEPDYDPCFSSLIAMQSGKLIDIWTIDTDYVQTNF